jgi:hypothetical protein
MSPRNVGSYCIDVFLFFKMSRKSYIVIFEQLKLSLNIATLAGFFNRKLKETVNSLEKIYINIKFYHQKLKSISEVLNFKRSLETAE